MITTTQAGAQSTSPVQSERYFYDVSGDFAQHKSDEGGAPVTSYMLQSLWSGVF